MTIDSLHKELDELEAASNALDVHCDSAAKRAVDDLTRYYSERLLLHELYGKP